MEHMSIIKMLTVFLCGVSVTGTALAQDIVPGLEDLIGVRGSSGERARAG